MENANRLGWRVQHCLRRYGVELQTQPNSVVARAGFEPATFGL